MNAAVLKTVKDVSPSGVRIPVSPQNIKCPEIYRGIFLSRRRKLAFEKRDENLKPRSGLAFNVLASPLGINEVNPCLSARVGQVGVDLEEIRALFTLQT